MMIPFKSMLKSLVVIDVRFTPKRILNVCKLLISMLVSKILNKQIVWGYPLYLMIEPTNICNLKCPMCPSGNGDMNRALGKLDFDNFKSVMDDVGDYIFQVQLWNQGEPFINKSFLRLVIYAKSKGVMVQTSTNGHFIRTDDEADQLIFSGLDQVIFSMDGTNKESYEKYRVGGDFNLVMETLERIAKAKQRLNSKIPLIELQFIIFKHNQEEIDNIIQICKNNKINRLSFKTAQVYSPEQAAAFLPINADFSRYTFDGKNYKMKGNIKNWCQRLWLNSTVNWDGTVTPCCFDKDADYAFGNIFEGGDLFSTVWKNGPYMRFRKQVMKNRISIDMCTNCTEGLNEPYTKIIEISDL